MGVYGARKLYSIGRQIKNWNTYTLFHHKSWLEYNLLLALRIKSLNLWISNSYIQSYISSDYLKQINCVTFTWCMKETRGIWCNYPQNTVYMEQTPPAGITSEGQTISVRNSILNAAKMPI